MRALPAVLLSFIGIVGGFGCGDSGASGPVVSVSPATIGVSTGDGATIFAATLSNGAVAPATWTLTGPGSISATSGATTSYLPPALGSSPGTATLRASASCGAGCASVGDNATITINAATTGTLTIQVGLPTTVPATLAVTGPAGYSNSITTASATTLTGLTPGTYTVTGAEIVDTTNTIVNSKYSAPPVTATVAANAAATAVVTYVSEPGYGLLWVPGLNANSLDGFTPGNLVVDKAPGVNLSASGSVQGILFDATGSLWASLAGSTGSVVSYAAASLTDGATLTPTVTLSDGMSGPAGIAIGPDARIWVANCGNNAVTAYSVAGGSAEVTIKTVSAAPPNNFNCPRGIAFDTAGNLWVTNFNGSALRIPNAQIQASYSQATADVTLTAPSGSTEPSGVAIDASGNVWVSFCGGSTVARYNASGTTVTASPAATLSQVPASSPLTLDCPVALALDNSGQLWVANKGTGGGGSTLCAFALTDMATGGAVNPLTQLSGIGITQGGLVFNPSAANLPLRH